MLPDEILAQLNLEYQCREQQINHLAALYSAYLPLPPFLNVYGLTATGKTTIVRSYFQLSRIPHVFINVRECITARHLLERIVAASLDALDEQDDTKTDRRPFARTENLSALCVNLGKMLVGHDQFVVVLDAVDKLREGSSTLVPALARLGESIPNLSLVLTTTLALTPSMIHLPSPSFLHFPPYTRTQLLTILGATPLEIFPTPPSLEQFPDYTPDLAAEDDSWLWMRYLQTVYDSLSKHTGRDLLSMKRCAMRLWRPFVEPIISGQFGTRDFSRLIINRRHLFQLEDSVLDHIISTHTSTSISTTNPDTIPTTPSRIRTLPKITIHDLPYYTTHLLIAAYLASYNPARTDITYFMKHTDKRKNKRRNLNTALSASASVTNTPGKRGGALTKHRKISRHLLTPSPFTLDRLFAIFRALMVEGGSVPQSADLYTQIATLASMRLLVRAGVGGQADALEVGGRWRVNFGWEVVRGLGRRVGVEVGEYLVGGVD